MCTGRSPVQTMDFAEISRATTKSTSGKGRVNGNARTKATSRSVPGVAFVPSKTTVNGLLWTTRQAGCRKLLGRCVGGPGFVFSWLTSHEMLCPVSQSAKKNIRYEQPAPNTARTFAGSLAARLPRLGSHSKSPLKVWDLPQFCAAEGLSPGNQ